MAAASLGLVLACAHAQEVEGPSTAQAATSESQADPEAQAAEADAPEQEPEPAGAAAPEGQAAKKKGRVAGGAEDPSEVPVASSPSGLLKPGAEKTVREKLGVEAGGGSLRAALQKFQKEHDLPATGILDQRTAEALGLDTDEIFERASGQ